VAVRLALDTNRYTDLARQVPDVVQTAAGATELCLPFVVLAELHQGFRNGSRRADNERQLKRFLAQPGVRVLWPDDATVDLYATLAVQLRQQATPIPTNDLWIAALTLQNGLTLYSRDRHFDHLAQVPRI
jgi:tRNA(fMet)-specific endonuclease VapC